MNWLKRSKVASRVRLRCSFRRQEKYSFNSFRASESLFRAFSKNELVDGKIEPNSMDLPDLSCNWSRFSSPEDVRIRDKGDPNCGCYSFTVKQCIESELVVPCHEPLCGKGDKVKNFAHAEIRKSADDVEPKRGRKFKSQTQKLKRDEWRAQIAESLKIEFHPVEMD